MEDPLQPLRHQILQIYDGLDQEKYCLIPTSRNLRAIVDKRHVTDIDGYSWYAIISRGDYISVAADVNGSRVSMQRLVISLETGQPIKEIKQVTFENKLTFDCRFENLVPKTGRTSVMRNRLPKRNSSSQMKGVRKKERRNGGAVWSASIKASLGRVGLGSYETEKEAALVYDAAAYLLFQESAFFNHPDLVPDPDALVLALDHINRFKNMKAPEAN